MSENNKRIWIHCVFRCKTVIVIHHCNTLHIILLPVVYSPKSQINPLVGKKMGLSFKSSIQYISMCVALLRYLFILIYLDNVININNHYNTKYFYLVVLWVCVFVCAFSETFGKCVFYLASSYLFIHVLLHQIWIAIYLLLSQPKLINQMI